MKTRLIFLIMLIVCFSCGTNNKSVADAQKEKIKGEVKEVVNTIYRSAEEVNPELANGLWLDSPDFIYVNNGKTFNYKEFLDSSKSYFSPLINQKGTIVDEKYIVIDNSNVLYTANTKWLMNFKDGHSILSYPWAMSFMIKKIDNKWRIIYFNVSGIQQSVKNSETPKGLNQVEMMKQFAGSWKSNEVKDTIVYFDQQPYGTGQDIYFKYIVKAKTVLEGKQLWGYVKEIDKYILAVTTEGHDIGIFVFWFTAKNKWKWLPYGNMSNPEKASIKYEGEFKSPDTFAETTIVNNNPVITYTYSRIKQ